MFVRTVKNTDPKGVTREYLRLVESYREGGKTKQRVIANIGSKEQLAPHAERIYQILRDEEPGEAEALGAWTWGPILAIRAIWDELRLGEALDRISLAKGGRRPDIPLSERVFVLVANRLCQPSSEHALADWLESYFVCDRAGRRWVPQWKQKGRVRVDKKQLQVWYRTLDQLLATKDEVEVALYRRLHDLFSIKVDLVFYDLTSTYFEGTGPSIAKHGYSRDKRPKNPQVLVGVVMVNGFPITHHVLKGNLRDATTVSGMIADLEARFEIGRIILVADRGMVTTDNLALFREKGLGYLVGLHRRRRERVYELVQRATGPWIDCPVGITASEAATPPRTRVQEVACDETGVRVFVVDSEERRGYEQGMRERSMERTRQALENLSTRVREGKIRAAEKIGASAARILNRNHGHRYFDWELTESGVFRFFEGPQLAREVAYEGKYLIQTEEASFTPVQAVQAYKELSDVERGFAELKDVLELRPIFHQSDDRVRAHIFVAALAFLIDRVIERKLKIKHCAMSARVALEALESVRLVDLDLPDQRLRLVTKRTPRAGQVLNVLGIRCAEPPTPPAGDETLE